MFTTAGIEMMVSFNLMEVQMRLRNSLTKGTLVSNSWDSHIKHHPVSISWTLYRVQSIRFPDSQLLNIRSYIKPTNSFQYLHRQSAHSPSVFKGWIRGECIRHLRNRSGQDALKNNSYRFQNPPGKKRIWTLRNWTCHARNYCNYQNRSSQEA